MCEQLTGSLALNWLNQHRMTLDPLLDRNELLTTKMITRQIELGCLQNQDISIEQGLRIGLLSINECVSNPKEMLQKALAIESQMGKRCPDDSSPQSCKKLKGKPSSLFVSKKKR
jgi:hypothetical protein